MADQTVRISLDIPADLHRKLKRAAASIGYSARQLILRSIEKAVEEEPQRPICRLDLRNHPIVSMRGEPFDLTNEAIYALIEFP